MRRSAARPIEGQDSGRAERGKPLSILVAIANHGTKNDVYAERLITEYRSMSHQVDFVVMSNIDKAWGEDVEMLIGSPTSNPWSLPFGHKRVFAERLEQYDLFVYTEDDTLLTEAQIDSFLRVTEVLPEHLIAGFLREERTEDGSRFISTVHNHFHWEPSSALSIAGHSFAYFSNEHAACYVLTRSQLRRAIESGGYIVEPHESRFDLLVTAATDPYTQCGFRKVICTSHIDEFILEHLPNAYLGKMGLDRESFDLQIEALRAIERQEITSKELLRTESKTWHSLWSKSYYEPEDSGLIDAVGEVPRRVLSVGCGWGATEAALVGKGHKVVSVVLDGVIGVCAEARGLEIVRGTVHETALALQGGEFDVILLSNVLHLAEQPEQFMQSYAGLLATGGSWVLRTPNFGYLPTVWKRLLGRPGYRELDQYAAVGLHPTTVRQVDRWLNACGARVREVRAEVRPRWNKLNRLSAGLLRRRLSPSLVIVAR